MEQLIYFVLIFFSFFLLVGDIIGNSTNSDRDALKGGNMRKRNDSHRSCHRRNDFLAENKQQNIIMANTARLLNRSKMYLREYLANYPRYIIDGRVKRPAGCKPVWSIRSPVNDINNMNYINDKGYGFLLDSS